ncbi:MAG: cytochrome C oxidase subunit IV family protein [Granulosicoccus sp.]
MSNLTSLARRAVESGGLPQIRFIKYLWLSLIGLTLFSAYIAERADTGFLEVSIMALVLAIKGRIIVDHFMELKHSHVVLRTLMRVYFYVIPALIIIVYLFPEQIARWTQL